MNAYAMGIRALLDLTHCKNRKIAYFVVFSAARGILSRQKAEPGIGSLALIPY
jgi:hypothetical protein